MVRLSAVQLTSTPDVNDNLERITKILVDLDQLPKAKEHIVVLPECCLFFGGKDKEQLMLAQQIAENPENLLINQLAQLAIQFNITLVAGTIPVLVENQGVQQRNKFYNRSCVFSPEGKLLDYYNKMHLFDTVFHDKAVDHKGERTTTNYCESTYAQAGEKAVVISTPFAKLGLSVCYDLRFPELYRQLQQQGADIISVPSAFTKVTGLTHWQPLLQARAIENQVFIIAAGQEGVHKNGRETWGRSMIISPWGEVMACHEYGEGFASVSVDLAELDKIRAKMPVAKHNRFVVSLKNDKNQ